MKLKINRKTLAHHIGIVQKAISSRTTMQILEGILMVAKDNTIILTATDTEISIVTKFQAIVEEEGEIVVNSRLFGDIVRKLNDDTIELKIENYNMNIKCGKSLFNITCQKAEDYPDLPHVDNVLTLQLQGRDFKNAVRKTSFAVSTDETRLVFTGVLMDIKENLITFVALDGFRMAIQKLPVLCDFQQQAIVPARSLNELVKIIEDEEEISLQISRNSILFKMTDTTFYSTLLSGEFFNYDGLLRDDHEISTEVDRQEFQWAIERASLLAREDRANLIKLSIHSDEIDITSNSEIGDVFERVSSTHNEKDLQIAFNSRYILEGIKTLEEDQIVLHFTDSVNPCIINEIDGEDYIYLVLPVRLAN